MATIKELIPINTDSISGVTITNAQATFLANTTTAGSVVGNACIVASGLKDIASLRNITATGLLDIANITFDGTITGTGGSASITGVTFDTITLDGPTIDTSMTGSAIDDALTGVIPNSDTTVPTSANVIDYVASEIAAVTDTNPLVPTDDTKLATSKAVAAYVAAELLASPYTAKAYCRFTGVGSDGPAPLSGDLNISSVTRTSAGNYTVVLDNAMSDSNYVIQGTGQETSGDVIVRITTITNSTTFSIILKNTIGATVNPDYVHIAVFGSLA